MATIKSFTSVEQSRKLAEKLAAVADNYGRPYEKDDKSKPNNRIVYTIFAGDSYIDLNVIKEL